LNAERTSLTRIFEGWEGYNTSLVHAVAPLTPNQLGYRPANHLRSLGELARHVSLGRLTWFVRMDAPGSIDLAQQVSAWETDDDGNSYPQEDSLPIADEPAQLVSWLNATWQMIADTISEWTVDDLFQTYRHTWNGTAYAVSRQWTIFRILAHDMHHGGELSQMLGSQGIEAFELSALGGHILLPPAIE
jgi:uncharacterized damage-inducible protein DinB